MLFESEESSAEEETGNAGSSESKEGKKRTKYEDEKQKKILDARTISNGLTDQDRSILKSFLGYEPTRELDSTPTQNRKALKRKSDACRFVSETLWPSSRSNPVNAEHTSSTERGKQSQRKDETVEKEGEGSSGIEIGGDSQQFALNDLLANMGNIPSIFFNPSDRSKEDILDELKKLFSEGREYNDRQETAFIRSFTAFPRIWERELSNHENYARLHVCGPVS